MIDPRAFIGTLEDLGVTFFTGVPDSLLKHLCAEIMEGLPPERHVLAANEGAAVGIALGHYLRTALPACVYLQNSGFGNTVNPLLSLADREVYGVPMLLLCGWRGQGGQGDEPQHLKQGRVMEPLLDALEIPWMVLPTDASRMEDCLEEAVEAAYEQPGPYALLVERNTFAEPTALGGPARSVEDLPSREDALVAVVEAVGDAALFVSTTGMLSRELFEYRNQLGADGNRDFLTVGGMGHCSSIALGIALEEEREVWCLDGDGAILMHLGSLAVIADRAPESFFHVVFNNGVHDSVGGQPTSIGVVDVPALAQSLGYGWAERVADLDSVGDVVRHMRSVGGPTLLEMRVRPGNRPGIGRPTRTPAQSKRAFMNALGAAR